MSLSKEVCPTKNEIQVLHHVSLAHLENQSPELESTAGVDLNVEQLGRPKRE